MITVKSLKKKNKIRKKVCQTFVWLRPTGGSDCCQKTPKGMCLLNMAKIGTAKVQNLWFYVFVGEIHEIYRWMVLFITS